jgi:hypothetical protein
MIDLHTRRFRKTEGDHTQHYELLCFVFPTVKCGWWGTEDIDEAEKVAVPPVEGSSCYEHVIQNT